LLGDRVIRVSLESSRRRTPLQLASGRKTHPICINNQGGSVFVRIPCLYLGASLSPKHEPPPYRFAGYSQNG